MDSGYSLADIRAATDDGKDGGMLGGGGGIWLILLFILFAFGGGGMFGGNKDAAAVNSALTRADLSEGFNFNNLEQGVRGVQDGLCSGFYAQNTTMLQGFNGLGTQLAENRFAAQQCCCETNRNIDAVRYENAKNTCDIITAGHSDAQRIIDQMTQNTVQELRDQLQAAQLTLGNTIQTTNIVNSLRPFPQPAYVTCSPYTSANVGCGCGCA